MKVLGATLLWAAMLVAVASNAVADEVDDLLTGKSLDSPTTSGFDAFGIVPGSDPATLAEGADWAATIADAPQPTPKAPATKPAAAEPKREPAQPSDVSLVPEPSAIALGIGAILYFLVFFRRRHLG